MPDFCWGTFLFLVILLVALIFLQRFLQREIQAIFLLITRQPELSMALFSLLFLPGVFLHETSHYLMARLLGVRTGRFSIIPKKLEGGRLQLGYVETAKTDFLRDALIGVAPLLTGGIVVAFIGVSRLGLNTLWTQLIHQELGPVNLAIKSVIERPDFWLWFYLIFAISSTMLPSASDRRAWMPLILVILGLVALILLIGVGPWILTRFGSAITAAVDAVTMVFGITVLIHLLLAPPAWLVRTGISRLVGLRVV
jgi:hypothetical protein